MPAFPNLPSDEVSFVSYTEECATQSGKYAEAMYDRASRRQKAANFNAIAIFFWGKFFFPFYFLLFGQAKAKLGLFYLPSTKLASQK